MEYRRNATLDDMKKNKKNILPENPGQKPSNEKENQAMPPKLPLKFIIGILILALLFIGRGQKPSRKFFGQRAAVLGASTACNTGLNNIAICPKESGIAAPNVGDIFTDPTFGTKIIRLTNERIAPTGADVNINPSESMFNSDSSLFFINYTGQATRLFSIDKKNQKVSDLGSLSNDLIATDIRWDPNNPRIFYAPGINIPNIGLYKFNISSLNPLSISKTLFFDVVSSTGQSLHLQLDQSGRYFAFMNNSFPDFTDYDSLAVWDSQTKNFKKFNTLLQTKTQNTRIDDYEMDPNGNYIIMHVSGVLYITPDEQNINPPDEETWYVWDLNKNSATKLTQSQDSFSNAILEQDQAINIFDGQFRVRNLSSPHNSDQLADLPDTTDQNISPNEIFVGKDFPFFFEGFYSDNNLSLGSFTASDYGNYLYQLDLAKNPDILSQKPDVLRYKGKDLQQANFIPHGPNQWYFDANKNKLYAWINTNQNGLTENDIAAFNWQPMTEEIVQFIEQSDGTLVWRRLGHHHDQFNGDVSTTPRVNSDPAGSYLLFSSNWDNTLVNRDSSPRTDVFMMFVPPLPPPSAPPVSAPTPTAPAGPANPPDIAAPPDNSNSSPDSSTDTGSSGQ